MTTATDTEATSADLTPSEVARERGVRTRTVQRWCASDRMPAGYEARPVNEAITGRGRRWRIRRVDGAQGVEAAP